MCVGSIAPIINPAGYALAQLPVPRVLSDPGQALAQKIVGKNVVTDPTYKASGTKDPAPQATALAVAPEDDPFAPAPAAKKTALGS